MPIVTTDYVDLSTAVGKTREGGPRQTARRILTRALSAFFAACCLFNPVAGLAETGGEKDGPFEFDHRIHYDPNGIWQRKYQLGLQYGLAAGAVGLALYEGSESRLGNVAWKTVDSMLITAGIVQVAKPVFSRARPSQSDNSGQFFQGKGYRSFPSGEVSHVAAAITPALLEYGQEEPWLYAVGGTLLIYDSVARMKTRGHWLSDVIGGAAIGAGTGYFMYKRDKSIIVQALPGGVFIGYSKRW